MAILYDEGTEHVDWVQGFSDATGSQSKQANHLLAEATRSLAQTGTAQRTWVIDESVDLTNAIEVKVEWAASNSGQDNTRRVALVVSTNKGGSSASFNERLDRVADFSRVEQTLDVSSLSGNHFIRAHAYVSGVGIFNSATSTIRVYRVETIRETVLVDGSDSLVLSTSLGARTLFRALSVSANLSAAVARTATLGRSFSQALPLQAAVGRTLSLARDFSESLGLSVALRRTVSVFKGNALNLNTSISKVVAPLPKAVSLALSAAGARASLLGRAFSDSLSLSTAIEFSLLIARAFTASLGLVAEMYAKLKQNLLNRLQGGGTIVNVVKRFFVVED